MPIWNIHRYYLRFWTKTNMIEKKGIWIIKKDIGVYEEGGETKNIENEDVI